MILVCPSCGTRYVVSPAAFVAGARQVRCARCSHEWLADRPPLDQTKPPPGLPPIQDGPPPAVKPLPPGSNLPALVGGFNTKLLLWIGLPVLAFVLLLAMGMFFIYGRVTIVNWFPSMAETYTGMGLRLGALGEGLTIQNIRSEQRLDSGSMMLALDGQVVNNARYAQKIPIIRATALGPNNQPVATWEMTAEPARLSPLEVATFSSSVPYPQAGVVEVTMAFVDPQPVAPAAADATGADAEKSESKANESSSSH
jgi:predicted Zn finger-like uncharacterized protein